MHCCCRVLFERSACKRKKGLVDHDFHKITMESCAFQQPSAKVSVHGAISVAVRHPLNQTPARRGKLIQLLADTPQVSRSESPQLAMDNDSWRGRWITSCGGA